jgi:CheY-like chemotaxis protein
VVGLAPEGPNYRILIVDDSYENRLLLEQMLSEVGFEVLTANDGKSAIELYQAWNPHLIWMDIRMPEMDGYQATRIIRESEGPETKIIAVSASAFEEEQARVLEAGCDDFVRKPFSDDEIFDVMAEHLGVRYICEDITPDLQDAEGVTLTPVDLKELPEYWVAALRSAATRGRNQELLNLIGQIEAENPEVAKALRDMVENFGYKDIVDLTG